MYNRYTPQGDGSYSKTWIPDPPRHTPPPHQPLPPRPAPPPPPPPPQEDTPRPEKCPPPPPRQDSAGSVSGFLRQLLPRNFDTGDLLIILLLLLMAGDCKEEQNTALLTLALYLFM